MSCLWEVLPQEIGSSHEVGPGLPSIIEYLHWVLKVPNFLSLQDVLSSNLWLQSPKAHEYVCLVLQSTEVYISPLDEVRALSELVNPNGNTWIEVLITRCTSILNKFTQILTKLANSWILNWCNNRHAYDMF